MDIRSSFEDMVQQYFPDADLARDTDHPEFYRDQAIQTTWVGFNSLHMSDSDTTNGTDFNYENDSGGNSEEVGTG